MPASKATAEKVHYVCQTYVEKKSGRGAPAGLQIGKQLQYSSESQANDRASREFESDQCVGADAYMVTEDPDTGEVSSPTFIVRLGSVPEFDEY